MRQLGNTSTGAALITGASAGIGRDLATIMAGRGHDLILAARDLARLEALASELRQRNSIRIEVIASDLSEPAAPQRLYDQIAVKNLPIEILINNAGRGTHGPFHESDVAAQLAMLQLNIVALTHLARLFLPAMVARKSGRIMNVASTAAFQPGPLMSVYYASKAYVLSFSEAVAEELKHTGVTVTALCPGPTLTEFQKRAGIENSRLFERGAMDSFSVALKGYDGMMCGRRVVIPGLSNRLLANAVKFAPRRAVTAVVNKMNQTR
ncbi:MAG: SDR family NAD(P)-dependent oxidoreductase [Tepidisphaeraceae bacterium]